MPDLTNKCIALFGPTATGKSDIAIAIAQEFMGEIINMDSVQIYQGMDIGSAKPDKELLQIVPHHLIDISSPANQLNTYDVTQQAILIAKKLLQKGITPIFSGGTGLYFKALFYGLFAGPGKSETIRARLKADALSLGTTHLHQRLLLVDPESAQRIKPSDYVRIERALEVYELSGTPLSLLQKQQTIKPDLDFIRLGINYPREILYERVERRIDEMLSQGLLEEVKLLAQQYPHAHILKQAIGYKEPLSYLNNQTTFEQMTLELKQNSRRYAKRQITLFKTFENTKWFFEPNLLNILSYLRSMTQI